MLCVDQILPRKPEDIGGATRRPTARSARRAKFAVYPQAAICVRAATPARTPELLRASPCRRHQARVRGRIGAPPSVATRARPAAARARSAPPAGQARPPACPAPAPAALADRPSLGAAPTRAPIGHSPAHARRRSRRGCHARPAPAALGAPVAPASRPSALTSGEIHLARSATSSAVRLDVPNP